MSRQTYPSPFKSDALHVVEHAPQWAVHHLARNMRRRDVEELRDGVGMTPRESLSYLVKQRSGRVWTVYSLRSGAHVPAVMFGTYRASMLTGNGVVWMLATDDIYGIKKDFLVRCQHFVDEMQRGYTVIYNHVDQRNMVSKRWLRWLGFTIEPAFPYGIRGRPFHRFHRTDSCADQPQQP